MRNERMIGTDSVHRNSSIESNLVKFEEMRQATEQGLKSW